MNSHSGSILQIEKLFIICILCIARMCEVRKIKSPYPCSEMRVWQDLAQGWHRFRTFIHDTDSKEIMGWVSWVDRSQSLATSDRSWRTWTISTCSIKGINVVLEVVVPAVMVIHRVLLDAVLEVVVVEEGVEVCEVVQNGNIVLVVVVEAVANLWLRKWSLSA